MLMAVAGPACYVAQIPEDADVVPKNKFGKPIEEMYPELPREQFEREMIVTPIKENT